MAIFYKINNILGLQSYKGLIWMFINVLQFIILLNHLIQKLLNDLELT